MAGQVVYAREPQFTEVLKNGSKTIAVGGTAEALSATSSPCYEVIVQAKPSNTDLVFVGGSGVPADGSAGIVLGIPIVGETPPSISISAQNLTQIYINSLIAGEGVNFIYW